MRQTFVEGTIPISPAGSTLPPAIRPSSGAVSPTREHSPRATPTHPATPSQPNHPFPSITDMVEVLTAPEGYTNAPAFNGPTANGGPRRPVPGASPDTLNARPGGTRTWGVSVDPLPPSAPPPAPGVRRPLGPLSHGQGAGLSPAAAAAAAVVAAANGTAGYDMRDGLRCAGCDKGAFTGVHAPQNASVKMTGAPCGHGKRAA